ncbi:hypothetical protein LCGC14_2826620 [marine sediment metagenome]|uniref:Uncharacterized protein n=1 Tax=marine sediment metagenome TaxID=412755 RepID=A0A0F8Z211_9ZZZZ
MPLENHEKDHEDLATMKRWMIETQANVRFVKWAASVGAIGLIARFADRFVS